MANIDAPGAWSVWTLGARLEQFIMGTTKHCYIQNLEALGLVVSDHKTETSMIKVYTNCVSILNTSIVFHSIFSSCECVIMVITSLSLKTKLFQVLVDAKSAYFEV